MKVIILFALYLIATFDITAQTDTIVQVDSSKEKNAELAVQMLIKSDSITTADSVYKILLKRQLDELRSSERTKRRIRFYAMSS